MKMIKNIAFAGVAALAIASVPAAAQSYVAPSANGKATVNLYDAIEIQKVADVDFGTLIRDASYTSGSVTLNASNTVGCAANMTCTGTTSTGVFNLKGDDGAEMQVTFAGAGYAPNGGENGTDLALAGNGQLTLVNTADSTKSVVMDVQVDGMTQDRTLTYVTPGDSSSGLVSYSNNTTFSTTGSGANQELRVFGSLAVPAAASAPNGVYEANFTLTADYK